MVWGSEGVEQELEISPYSNTVLGSNPVGGGGNEDHHESGEPERERAETPAQQGTCSFKFPKSAVIVVKFFAGCRPGATASGWRHLPELAVRDFEEKPLVVNP